MESQTATKSSVRLLDPHTVNQIAAGEVVERPASVVKELVENAIDAGARSIEVHLTDSGRTQIRVVDDGAGMEEADALHCIERHATSKITTSEDLAAVRTLGFRGEALPSIASVSRMTLATGVADGRRLTIRIEGGSMREPRFTAGPRGTDVAVDDLFFNTPARLKFLKSDSTELGQSFEHVSRYAVGYPHIAFALFHNGQVGLRTSGRGDMLEAVADVWGREAARSLAPMELEIAGLRVSGFVSPPHMTKPTRAYQYVFVNGRPVRTRTLTAAIDTSFRDITPERRYPLLALLIDVDPARIDVNVSPTKSEVKFQQEGAAFDAIRLAVKGALMEHGMIPDASAVAAANEALAAARAAPLGVFPAAPIETPVEDFRLYAPEPPQGSLAMPRSDLSPSVASAAMIPAGAPGMPFASLMDGLRVIGQAMDTFIIAETRHGVVIIDQHVAHERILYEYLCGLKGRSAIEQQALLVPQTLELDRRSAMLLRERIQEVIDVGFDIEPFGGESYVVRAVPAAIRTKDPVRVLRSLVEELVEASVTRRLVPTREQIWITSACHMAVKAGDPLSFTEMEKLIADLAITENPYLCPHGRPITVTLGTDAILRLFKRM